MLSTILQQHEDPFFFDREGLGRLVTFLAAE